MLKIENVETFGWEAAVRGMRNPKNSWEKSDSDWHSSCDGCVHYGKMCHDHELDGGKCFHLGENDLKLMHTLVSAGTDHRKFMRMIVVSADITAPLYWFKEYDTYKVGTVANSCSTMHKITDKELSVNDFSHEHIEELTGDEYNMAYALLSNTVDTLNYFRQKYFEAKTKPMKEESKRAGLMKTYWHQLIQLLPSSYNQRRTVMLNYEVLANMYKSRRNHKLDEWHTLCNWVETLPHSELITGKKD